MYNQQEESTINLTNLFGHLLIKWKVILYVSVIAAVIGGVIGLLKNGDTANVKTKDPETLLTEAKAKLTEDQIAEAEELYSVLISYDKAIEDRKTINEKSYIMSIDPFSATRIRMQYLIKTDIDDCSTTFSKDILSEEDYKEMSDLMGSDIGKEGMEEALSVETSKSGLDNSTDFEKTRKTVMSIGYIAPNKDICNKVIEILDKAVGRRAEHLNKQGARLECTLVDTVLNDSISADINDLQQDTIVELGSLYTNRTNFLKNVVGKVDANEKIYFDSLSGIMPEEVKDESRQEGASSNSILVYVIIGLLVGCLLSIGWFVTRYIFDGRVHTVFEFSELSIPVMRELPIGTKQGDVYKTDKITDWGYKLIGVNKTIEDSIELLCSELNNITGRDELKKIYIAADKEADRSIECANRISDGTTEGVIYTVGELEPNSTDMKSLLDSDGVIILSVVDITKRKRIMEFLNICKRNSKCIIGIIPIIGRIQ